MVSETQVTTKACGSLVYSYQVQSHILIKILEKYICTRIIFHGV